MQKHYRYRKKQNISLEVSDMFTDIPVGRTFNSIRDYNLS